MHLTSNSLRSFSASDPTRYGNKIGGMKQMELNQVSQLATAISAVLAAGSIYAVFRVYNIGRRDDKLRKLRESIIAGKTSVEKMNGMLNHEIAYEITQSILAAPQVAILMKNGSSTFSVDLI